MSIKKSRSLISNLRETFRILAHVAESGVIVSDEAHRLVNKIDSGEDTVYLKQEARKRRATNLESEYTRNNALPPVREPAKKKKGVAPDGTKRKRVTKST